MKRAPAPATLDPAPVLDIGADVGAALVMLAGPGDSSELWACPRHRPDARFHTGVHLRHPGGVARWVALFPALTEGEYSLLTDEGLEYTPFTVSGGAVTVVEQAED